MTKRSDDGKEAGINKRRQLGACWWLQAAGMGVGGRWAVGEGWTGEVRHCDGARQTRRSG